MSKFLIVLGMIFSANLVSANNQPVIVDEPVVIIEEEPEESPLMKAVQFPFMTCDFNNKQADFSNVTLSISLSDPNMAMVTAMSNPTYFEDEKEDLEFAYGHKYDFTNYKFSPVGYSDLSLTVLAVDDNTVEINGGIVGFTSIKKQQIKLDKVSAKLTLSSLLDDQELVVDCSLQPWILKDAFKIAP